MRSPLRVTDKTKIREIIAAKKTSLRPRKKNQEVANLSIENVESVLLEDNFKQAVSMNFVYMLLSWLGKFEQFSEILVLRLVIFQSSECKRRSTIEYSHEATLFCALEETLSPKLITLCWVLSEMKTESGF